MSRIVPCWCGLCGLAAGLAMTLILPAARVLAQDQPPPVSSVRDLDKALADKELASYTPVDLKTLEASLERERGKKIVVEVQFQSTITTPPDYMEKAGIRAERYSYLRSTGEGFIVVAKHTDELDALIATLKPRMHLKVYGVVQRFSVEPRNRREPLYYLDAAHLTVVDLPPTAKDKARLPPVGGGGRPGPDSGYLGGPHAGAETGK